MRRSRRERSAREQLLAEVLESELQTSILDAARKLGWKHYHTHNSRRSPSGFPDLVLVKPPRVIFAELKREREDPDDEQLVWYGLLIQCPGVESYVWRPRDIDDVLQVLQGGGGR